MLDREPASVFSTFTPVTAAEWAGLRHRVLAEWTRNHPGTRPAHWWKFDAPEPRRRLGGTGTPLSQVWPAFRDTLDKGIPTRWRDVDPDDPPTFESEAAYIERLDLFRTRERARVPADNYEPIKIRRNVP